MQILITKGRLLFGLAIAAFGVENFFCVHLGLQVRGVPWFPESPWLGYLIGIALLAAGLSIVANIRARCAAVLLGILLLLLDLLIEAPRVAAKPMGISVRTVFFETLAIGSAALTLAATLPPRGSASRWDSVLEKFIKSGPYLFGISSVVFGIDHFLVLDVIASLVPAWLPGHMFWAYLTGTAFVAAGTSILTKWIDQFAAFMLGTMFALWFLILHSPRSVSASLSHDPNVQNEWSSAFIALAMWGGCWIIAWHAQQRRRQQTQ
ncbi:MAG: hypothetical protein ACLP6G_03430 [Terriglobales bacterium]